MVDNSKSLAPIDPNVFLAFDRLDDEQIIAEMKGAALSVYVYEFSQGGQTVRGLSKVGTDDAARLMAVKYGEALREVDAFLEKEDNEAGYFKAIVKRYIIKEDGTAIEMDSAIGHKRQSKMVGNKPNAFWYEQGGQKALRNAKQKLMPETIKQAIIASYIQAGKVRRVTREDITPAQEAQQMRPKADEQPLADDHKRQALINQIRTDAEKVMVSADQLDAFAQSYKCEDFESATLTVLDKIANRLADLKAAKEGGAG